MQAQVLNASVARDTVSRFATPFWAALGLNIIARGQALFAPMYSIDGYDVARKSFSGDAPNDLAAAGLYRSTRCGAGRRGCDGMRRDCSTHRRCRLVGAEAVITNRAMHCGARLVAAFAIIIAGYVGADASILFDQRRMNSGCSSKRPATTSPHRRTRNGKPRSIIVGMGRSGRCQGQSSWSTSSPLSAFPNTDLTGRRAGRRHSTRNSGPGRTRRRGSPRQPGVTTF